MTTFKLLMCLTLLLLSSTVVVTRPVKPIRTAREALEAQFEHEKSHLSYQAWPERVSPEVVVTRPVKPIRTAREALEAQFEHEKAHLSYQAWPERVSPEGPDPHDNYRVYVETLRCNNNIFIVLVSSYFQ
ncbi:Hypothetical predicted protein [Olea europaea subsp. europaea]|uniref:Uncharacterized protein n=1 Tax=Olea europaea subsp. europaea TaxID=158383 RepID=A0A8S0QSS5_OLEEU|nr:Hypothetical predicted protein [Olea europaea subsp. europaea]